MPERSHDVIVVGSGATGGWAAYEFTRRGLRVLLLEAGAALDPDADLHDDGAEAALLLERRPIQSTCYACTEGTAKLFVDDRDNPYVTARNTHFRWIRSRQLGGRTTVWSRHVYRFSDTQLRAGESDGLPGRWPLSYGELAPFYARVERRLGVSGRADRLDQLPDGWFVPCSPSPTLDRLARRLEGALPRLRATPGRTVVPKPSTTSPGTCARNDWRCHTWASTSSLGSTILAANATGLLTLRTDSIVSHVLVRAGRAYGVRYIDAKTETEHDAVSRAVVLSASTLESTRILMHTNAQSSSAEIGSTSGVLGRHLMDHLFTEMVVSGPIDDAGEFNGKPGPYPSLCAPAVGRLLGRRDFARDFSVMAGIRPAAQPGDGRTFWLVSYGEMLPDVRNRVTLDSGVDAWGIPVLRIECRLRDNDRRMARSMKQVVTDLAEAISPATWHGSAELQTPGLAAHEVGTARMGSGPDTSVLNSWNQCWEIPNLLVTDGACFPSIGFQHPTLTMMALTARACDHLVELFSARVL